MLRKLARKYGNGRGRRCQLERLEERALLSATTADVGALDDLWYSPPQHNLYQLQGFLTEPKEADPLDIAVAYIEEQASNLGLVKTDMAHLIVTDRYTDDDTGVTHIYLSQELNGLPISNSVASVHLTKAGEIAVVSCSLVGDLDRIDSRLEPALAIQEALSNAGASFGLRPSSTCTIVTDAPEGAAHKMTLSNADYSEQPIPAKLEYVATPTGVSLAWNMVLALPTTPDVFSVSVDASSGEVLSKCNRVSYASYRVYKRPSEGPADDPSQTPPPDNRELVTPAFDTASPNGWHLSTLTEGNNVSAAIDYYGDNQSRILPSNQYLTFDYALNYQQESFVPPTTPNQQSSVTNLFYWVNTLHDVTFHYGFTEAAGNFQSANTSGQGYGNDRVIADCLDGAYDSSNFGNCYSMQVWPDGTSPIMELGPVLYYPQVSRDTALDSQVIVHEYAHGISKRLVGGAANVNVLSATQSRQIGEGFSDWLALMFTQKDSDQKVPPPEVGPYQFAKWSLGGTSDYRYAYNYTFDLAYFSALHPDYGRGVWGNVLWDLNWELIDRHGFSKDLFSQGYVNQSSPGNVIALKLVMDAMKIMPANPTFIEARDAILIADSMLTGGQNSKAIWAAFVHRGMGINAYAGSDANSTTVTANFLSPLTGATVDTPGLYDGTSSTFYLRNSNSSGPADISFGFGAPGQGWLPIAGDWNGDGFDTIGLYEPSTSIFYMRNTNSSGYADIVFGFGAPGQGWLPVAGDWNGDGIDTIGLYEPSTSIFYMRNANSGGNADIAFGFGPPGQGWKPIAGNWDGDAAGSGVGLYDSAGSTFYLKNVLSSGGADYGVGFGPLQSTWKPFAGDWDANGKENVGLYSLDSLFLLRNQNVTGLADITLGFGSPWGGWLPIAGDWDGTSLLPLKTCDEVSNSPAVQITQADLQPIVAAAIRDWANAGLPTRALEELSHVEFQIVDLPGCYLGVAKPGFVYVDVNGAGHGWYMPASEARKGLDPEAVDQVDLYSTVLHELGHTLGLEDSAQAGDDLMSGILAPGARRSVTHDDALAVLLSD